MAYVVTGYWDAGYTISDSEADLTSQIQGIAPGAIIELFQLELNAAQHGVDQTYYFHAGVDQSLADITWDGQDYQAIPMEADGFEWNGQGSLPRPTLRASNVLGTLTALIFQLAIFNTLLSFNRAMQCVTPLKAKAILSTLMKLH